MFPSRRSCQAVGGAPRPAAPICRPLLVDEAGAVPAETRLADCHLPARRVFDLGRPRAFDVHGRQPQALSGDLIDDEFGALGARSDRHLAPGVAQCVFGVLVVLAEQHVDGGDPGHLQGSGALDDPVQNRLGEHGLMHGYRAPAATSATTASAAAGIAAATAGLSSSLNSAVRRAWTVTA